MKRIRSHIKTGVVLLAVSGLGFGLFGSGVRAAFTDGGTAAQNIKVGTLACTLSSTDPNAAVSPDGHTITVNWPDIASAGAGSDYSNVTVTNSGEIPEVVHWTWATAGTISWQPAGSMGYTVGSVGNLLSTDLTLASGANHPYANLGFQWAALTNADLGATASVSYTASCSELPAPPPPPVSKISFVGAANMATVAPPSTAALVGAGGTYTWVSQNGSNPPFGGTGILNVASTSAFPSSGTFTVVASGGTATVTYTGTTATSFTGSTTITGTGYVTPGAAVKGAAALLALPVGSQPGDLALVMTYGATGGNNPQVPAGYTTITSNAGAGNMQTDLSDRVLVAGDSAVPAVTTGYGVEVAVYRGVSGIGAHTYNGGNVNNIGGAAFPLISSALTLTKTDGSSWVASMGGDGFATTNANTMVFDSNTTNRSAALPDNHTGLADTNAGMKAWAAAGWPGDNFVLPGSHSVVVHSIELLSK